MKIVITDAYDVELFDIFFRSVISHGGDGSGIIVCQNPRDLSERFLAWCEQEVSTFQKALNGQHTFSQGKRHPHMDRLEKDISDGYVNFHDSNENFMFCTQEWMNYDYFPPDTVIIVEGTLKTMDDKIIQE